jgi:hypothetical protein
MQLLASETRRVGGDGIMPHSLDNALPNPRSLLRIRDAWRDNDRALNYQFHFRILGQVADGLGHEYAVTINRS